MSKYNYKHKRMLINNSHKFNIAHRKNHHNNN